MSKKLKATFGNILLTPISEDDFSEDQLEESADNESDLEFFKVYDVGNGLKEIDLPPFPLHKGDIVVVDQILGTLFFDGTEYSFVTANEIIAVLQ